MSRVGIAGTDNLRRVGPAMAGIAGEIRGRQCQGVRPVVGHPLEGLQITRELQERDSALARATQKSRRLADSAIREAARQTAVWFPNFFYLATPFPKNGKRGVMSRRTNTVIETGRATSLEHVFGRNARTLPLYIDSGGYAREISGKAARWTHSFEYYLAAKDLIDPDGWAAFDFPMDKSKTIEYLERTVQCYPQDPTLWPIYSSPDEWIQS